MAARTCASRGGVLMTASQSRWQYPRTGRCRKTRFPCPDRKSRPGFSIADAFGPRIWQPLQNTAHNPPSRKRCARAAGRRHFGKKKRLRFAPKAPRKLIGINERAACAGGCGRQNVPKRSSCRSGLTFQCGRRERRDCPYPCREQHSSTGGPVRLPGELSRG